MMRRAYLLITLLIVSSPIFGQAFKTYSELGLFGGVSYYMGLLLRAVWFLNITTAHDGLGELVQRMRMFKQMIQGRKCLHKFKETYRFALK
jgi:hypothetical protein